MRREEKGEKSSFGKAFLPKKRFYEVKRKNENEKQTINTVGNSTRAVRDVFSGYARNCR
jgi:hypothetical protein